jgi:23S rRNA pseudouridine2457 synthase
MSDYFLIYKPYLVLSQFSPVEGKQTLADYFKVPRDVYPVGRLDHDSEGLLILTNDKSLNSRLLDPKQAHQREYWVQVDGAIDDKAIDQLRHGVEINIDGKTHRTRPAIVSLFEETPMLPPRNPPIRFRKEIPAPWISITLTEGKNRQVRRMTAAVGFPTLRLIRYRIGQLALGKLEPGMMIQIPQKTIYQKLFHEHDR